MTPTRALGLVERPQVASGARGLFEQADVAQRCSIITGDMFTLIPEGGDVYILKRVIHDWDDERAIGLLRTCRSAMMDSSRLLLAEPMITPGDTPHPSKFLDLQMLVSQGGRERTHDEFESLLHDAGFALQQTIPTGFLLTLLDAIKT